MRRSSMLVFFTLIVCSVSAPKLTLGAGGFGYGCGSNSPFAQSPFGPMRLGPDTTPPYNKLYADFQHYGGYSDGDKHIRGFSHMHLVGAGVQDLGIFGVLPVKESAASIPKSRILSFFKQTQYAEPGYYKVDVQGGIEVELTSTTRAGVHKYTAAKGQTITVYLMAGYFLEKAKEHWAKCKFTSNNSFQAEIITKGSFGSRIGGLKSYVYAQWKEDVTSKGTWNDSSISQGMSASGNNTGGFLIVKGTLTLYVGLSYVSVANAKWNLYQQTSLRPFQSILESVKSVWKDQLSRFDITAITKEDQIKIDTAIFRTFQSPTILNDWNGDYPSFKNDGSIDKVPGQMKNVYTDMSLWDVHRTQMPWILFHDAQRYNDIAWSLMLINENGGYMPKQTFASGPTGCMIGAHANNVLSDWIVKEGKKTLTEQQMQTALGYMLRNANNNTPHDSRPDPVSYLRNQYIPFQSSQSS